MKVVYLPVYRMAVSYQVSFGRRWSALEHLLLVDLARERRSVSTLAQLTDLPNRLVVEALINLLRAGWIEVRSTEKAALFEATPTGRLRSTEETLPSQLQRATKWMSLCIDRVTGTWMRANDLELIYEKDMPSEPKIIEPVLQTYNPLDNELRDLLYVEADEALEPIEPIFRNPSRPYARITVEFDEVGGLPPHTPIRLKELLLEEARLTSTSISTIPSINPSDLHKYMMDDILDDDVVVGGAEHLTLLQECLENARSCIVIHSCFVHPETIRKLLPYFEKAAKRKVRIELLWGLNFDPEDPESRRSITESQSVLNGLPPAAHSLVQLSEVSSGSHAKVIIYDSKDDGRWVTILGSCNFLSSWFDAIDISVRVRSQRLSRTIMGQLISTQLPAAGDWPRLAKRMNRIWDKMRVSCLNYPEIGKNSLQIICDTDHYTCVRQARDGSDKIVALGCDLWGEAAETSVLVPLQRAAEIGKKVLLNYKRPSKALAAQGRKPDIEEIKKRGIHVSVIPTLHGKFLVWGADNIVITSFNWLSTVVDGARKNYAEIGLLISGEGPNEVLRSKLSKMTNQQIDW